MQPPRDKYVQALAARRWPERSWQLAASAESLIVGCSLFWALASNKAFIGAALQGQALAASGTWAQGLALVGLLTGAHIVVLTALGLLAPGPALKWLLGLLLVVAASASHFIQSYGVVLDPSMMRNVLHTNPPEAGELLTWSLGLHLLLYAGLPLLLLSRIRLVRRGFGGMLLSRGLLALLGLALFVGSLMAIFPSFGPLMREHKELRYLATPTNVLWSSGAVAAQKLRGAARPRQAIGLDAKPGAAMAARQLPGARPLVVVLVVGETARAANWGLSGYPRNTTPQLGLWPLTNWRHASTCGTNTETSLPCMFAPVGRRDYDEATIRGSESLLHVVARAGVAVRWRDNQSGCKGSCDGLQQEQVKDLQLPGLCDGPHCLDEGLIAGLQGELAKARGTQLLVLHMLGNHGPAYFKRYPPAFEHFKPACHSEDLRRCSREEITNAYDNALLYTDHVLARTLAMLKANTQVDSALVFASDHGESLGENNLYLHGLPYAIAPDVQKQVPMFLWLSDGLAGAAGGHGAAAADAPAADAPAVTEAPLNPGCLQQLRRDAVKKTAAHDHLFHTLLGLLDVGTSLYDPAWDLLQGCRKPFPG
jgi:lipid A ethanolaminephosphotransferase